MRHALAFSFFSLVLLSCFTVLCQQFGFRLFGRSPIWWQELSLMGMGLMLVLGMVWVGWQNTHLKMDFRPSWQRISQIILPVVLLVVLALIALTFAPWAWRSLLVLETSANPSSLGFVWLIKGGVALGLIALPLLWLMRSLRE